MVEGRSKHSHDPLFFSIRPFKHSHISTHISQSSFTDPTLTPLLSSSADQTFALLHDLKNHMMLLKHGQQLVIQLEQREGYERI